MTAKYIIGERETVLPNGIYGEVDLQKLMGNQDIKVRIITTDGGTFVISNGLDICWLVPWNKNNRSCIVGFDGEQEHKVEHIMPEVRVRQVEPVWG